MLDPSQLTLFVGASLALVAIPGPAVAFIVARSLAEGARAGIATAAGIAIGNLCQALAAAFGLAAALSASPIAYQAIKYAGAAYLLYLGLRSFLAPAPISTEQPRPSSGFRQGALVGLLNPKVALFLLAFLPGFADPARGQLWLQLLALGSIFVIIGWVGDSLWAACAGLVVARIRRNRASPWPRYASGAIYCLLGLATALWGG